MAVRSHVRFALGAALNTAPSLNSQGLGLVKLGVSTSTTAIIEATALTTDGWEVVGGRNVSLAAGARVADIHQLQRFIVAGDEQGFAESLELGADINGQDENGQTPVIAAASGGSAAILETLLDRGAEMDGKNKVTAMTKTSPPSTPPPPPTVPSPPSPPSGPCFLPGRKDGVSLGGQEQRQGLPEVAARP